MAEAIVPAIEPDDRNRGRCPPGNYRRRGIEMSAKQSHDASRCDTKAVVPRAAATARHWSKGISSRETRAMVRLRRS
jgi:hypothetical protein